MLDIALTHRLLDAGGALDLVLNLWVFEGAEASAGLCAGLLDLRERELEVMGVAWV